MTCKEFLENYSNAVRNQWTWVSGNSDRQTIRQSVFIAAAKLLAGGYKDHTITKDTTVGYLVDEGGWIFTQTIGTLGDVIMREAESFDEVSFGRHHDDEYLNFVSYVPHAMIDNENYPDMVHGDFYALISIRR